MTTPASIAKHPLHPMLITIPVGLWVFSLIADFIAIGTGNLVWVLVAFYTLVGGEIGALVAAIPGFIDFKYVWDRHGPRARRVVAWHMILNLSIVCIVAVNIWLRLFGAESAWPIILSVLAVGMLAASGWLGGELVHVLGVSTAREPEPAVSRAPTSLDTRPASHRTAAARGERAPAERPF
jgi:uncharacterized membrane protein